MLRIVLDKIRLVVQILSVVLLAGVYVYAYQDYLRTVNAKELLSVSEGRQSSSDDHFGVLVIKEEVTIYPSSLTPSTL